MSNYPIRLPDNVLAEAKRLAAANGTSLNQFISSLIAERIGEMKAIAGSRHASPVPSRTRCSRS